jgi:hypothetical protein
MLMEREGRKMTYHDPSRWFDALGTCPCGKRATGVLRGTQNQSMGPYCERCAAKRIKKAQQDRSGEAPGKQGEAPSGTLRHHG